MCDGINVTVAVRAAEGEASAFAKQKTPSEALAPTAFCKEKLS